MAIRLSLQSNHVITHQMPLIFLYLTLSLGV